MSFLTGLALLIGLLSVGPYVAHRLRRLRATPHVFPATRLVAERSPRARRRASLGDLPLFVIRVLGILALAILGATPLVRCSGLSLDRSKGASIALALVIDDSLSMRAIQGDVSRSERARSAARELLGMLREGDVVAVVAAGKPARVLMSATSDTRAAMSAIDRMTPSDRATDLDGALAMAEALIKQLPHVDKRVALLSDRADGRAAPPLGEAMSVPLWVPIVDWGATPKDCAILSAERVGAKVRVRTQCSSPEARDGRGLDVMNGRGEKIATMRLPAGTGGESRGEVSGDHDTLSVRLTGRDDIPSDDEASVSTGIGESDVLVVADKNDDSKELPGAPVIEQALLALRLDTNVVPRPLLPERLDELTRFHLVVLDDPPGFTPEERKVLSSWLALGRTLVMGLGPRAASAPLGASFEPLLGKPPTWSARAPVGVKKGGDFGDMVDSWGEIFPRGRSVLSPDDEGRLSSIVAWSDGLPLLAKQEVGRGEVWVFTLPFALRTSDLSLRPAFLDVLDAIVVRARQRAGTPRSEVGVPWAFETRDPLRVVGPGTDVWLQPISGAAKFIPSRAGVYRATRGEESELRLATIPGEEITFAARPVSSSTLEAMGSQVAPKKDLSPHLAFVLLLLLTFELSLRLRAARRAPDDAPAAS